MAPMIAYILHKNGVIDDTALELKSAAEMLEQEAVPVAVVMGSKKMWKAFVKRQPGLLPPYGRLRMKRFPIRMPR